LREPARYRAGMTVGDIRALESQTVSQGERLELTGTKAEYVRQTDEVIGWDRGEDAVLSFVECSGGLYWGRAFHGRPMSETNIKGQRS
jgi:hypothetical protein